MPGPRSRTSSWPGAATSLHGRPGRGVAQCVLDERIERPLDVGPRAPRRRRARPRRCIRGGDAASRQRRAATARRRSERLRRDRAWRPSSALAAAAQDEQLLDRVREPVDLGDRRVELVRRRPRAQRPGLLEPQSQPVSGVRSWCEASATKSRCARSSREIRSVISLNESASERCSRLPSSRRPRGQVAVRDATGDRLEAPDRPSDAGRDHRSGEAARGRARSARSDPSPNSTRWTALCSAATLCVMRTAPTARPSWMIGTAVARISWPSVVDYRCTCTWRPDERPLDLRAALVARADLRRGRRCRRARRHLRSTIRIRPRIVRAAVSRERAGGSPVASRASRSAAVAATRSACPWAWVRTSALTRALRLTASGTPSAMIASSST